MNNFVVQENKSRINKYKKNKQDELLLALMNHALASIVTDNQINANYPTLFVFGLPRSGTTLIYQLIAQCLKIGYVNNLIARFWKAPQIGITLSNEVLGSLERTCFVSDYGKTSSPYGPHEFAYFWQHWLQIDNISDMLIFHQENHKIDWDGLAQQIHCMQESFQAGIVFKTMYVANHIQAFSDSFSMPLFIYIERDPIDVALSILEARRSYYGSSDIWWATYPPNYNELKDLSVSHQIAGQVHFLRKTYEKSMDRVEPDQVVRLTYSQLCESPLKVLHEITARIERLYGYDIKERLDAPDHFNFRCREKKKLNADQFAIIKAFNKYSSKKQ